MKLLRKADLLFLVGLLLCIAGIVAVSGRKIYWGLPHYDGIGGIPIPAISGAGLSCTEKIAVLNELGFSFTEAEQEELENWPDVGYEDMLAVVGWGEFDEETWEWSPTSAQVYALDTEVFDIDRMYIDFIQGLLSISNGELPITDVAQDNGKVDMETGTGTFEISLKYNEKSYCFTAVAMYDWLDVGVLGQINDMLKNEGVEKRFYATWNRLQGITVFFRSEDWVKRFEKATGCQLYTKL